MTTARIGPHAGPGAFGQPPPGEEDAAEVIEDVD